MDQASPDGPAPAREPAGRRDVLRGIAAAGPSASRASSPAVRRGGNLALGLTGGSPDDTIDPHKGLTYTDTARLQALYSPLIQLDAQAQQVYVLAESITPERRSPSRWVIRLRPGLTFHDGRDVTADDVIFTLRRIISGHFTGSIALGPVQTSGLRKLDPRTVLVPMTSPYASFPEQLAAFWYYLYIVPAGFRPAKPNGTGPFVFGSFTPGQRSAFTRNPHYFRTGLPYADTLSIVDFPDGVALQNALQTGVVQGAGTLEGGQIAGLNATLDPARRRGLLHEMQRYDFEQGGYIIPAYIDTLDAYSTKITGWTTSRVGQPLSNFGFENFAFTS